MTGKRKFAALAGFRHQQDAAEPEPGEGPPAPIHAAVELLRPRGRPPTGKRSNPDWKLYSHFLKKRTQRAAVARLQAADDGRDLSDVLEELLDDWLKT